MNDPPGRVFEYEDEIEGMTDEQLAGAELDYLEWILEILVEKELEQKEETCNTVKV